MAEQINNQVNNSPTPHKKEDTVSHGDNTRGDSVSDKKTEPEEKKD